jgi:hypothetical protein
MFKIILIFNSFDYSGIEALDARRKHRLPDGTRLIFTGGQITLDIDEAYARKNFTKEEVTATERIQFELIPADCLKERDGSPDGCSLNIELAELRAGDIFRTARLSRRRKEVLNKMTGKDDEDEKYWGKSKRGQIVLPEEKQ